MPLTPATPSPAESALPRADAQGGVVHSDWESTGRELGGIAVAGAGLGLIFDGATRSASSAEVMPAPIAAPPLTISAPSALMPDAGTSMPKLRPSAAALGGHERTEGEKRFNFTTYKLTAIGTFLISAAALYWAKSDSKVWLGLTKSERTMGEAWKATAKRIGDWNGWQSVRDSRLGRMEFGGWKPLDLSPNKMTEVGDHLLSTTAAFTGGNVMLSIILPREAHKAEIVHKLNVEYSTPEEVERGDARVAEEPKQRWGSIVGGRIAAFLTVFVSLNVVSAAISIVAGRLMKSNDAHGRHNSDALIYTAEKGLKSYVKAVADGTESLSRKFFPNMGNQGHGIFNKIGESMAVDAFATVAAVSILETTSRAIAKRRDRRHPPALQDRPLVRANETQSFARQIGAPEKPAPRAASYLAQAEREQEMRAALEPGRG